MAMSSVALVVLVVAVIGPPIETKGVEPRAVNERAQRWIEDTLAQLKP